VLVKHAVHELQDAWLVAAQGVDRHAAGQALFSLRPTPDCGPGQWLVSRGGWTRMLVRRRELLGPCPAGACQHSRRTAHGRGCLDKHHDLLSSALQGACKTRRVHRRAPLQLGG